ncbi:hypothetical protein DL93DRAFT_2147337 [Clavulina sp. PMI_390]|nr:hypothetical protein DL93DRAFT_2147337 [Clavulina sp. PMI_390]
MSFLNSLGKTMGRGGRQPSPNPHPQQMQYQRRSPIPPSPRSNPLYMSNPFVKAALVKGNFKTIVAQPKYCDTNEVSSIAILFDFYTNLNMFYSILSDLCTPNTCKTMSAGPTLDYTWIDANRKNVKLPAATYIDYVMSWVQQTIDNGQDFPTKLGADFQPNFALVAKQIYRQLLRVFAHIYHAHFQHLLHLSAEGHFNSLFAHFLAFGDQYNLLKCLKPGIARSLTEYGDLLHAETSE